MIIPHLHLLLACTASLLFCIALPAADSGPDEAPDRAVMRAKVQTLIAERVKAGTPVNLGLLRDALEWSIAYGAPTYNNGDHAGCADFYQTTAQQIGTAFTDPKLVDEAARPGLADLRAALARVVTLTDADRRAWTMRLAFDQVFLAWQVTAEHGKQLVLLGHGYFKRGQYQEAGVAYAQAAALLEAVRTAKADDLDIVLRAAPLLHAQTAFTLGRNADAATECAAAIPGLPELHATGLDLRELYGDGAVLTRAVEALRAEADAHPADAGLHFLLGYQYLSTRRIGAAVAALRKAAAIDPAHAAAQALLKAQRADESTIP